MVDPTSDVGDVHAEDAPTCEYCSEPVTGDDHRVTTEVVDDRVEHAHFCDDDCLDAWCEE